MLSFVSIVVLMVIPQRHLFFLSGAPRLFFAAPLVVFIAGLLVAYAIKERELFRQVTKLFRTNIPLIAFLSFNILFVVVSYIVINGLTVADVSIGLQRWWINFFLTQLSVLCAWYIGTRISVLGNKKLGIALVVALGGMLTLALGEYFHLGGFHNPIGAWIGRVNDISLTLHSVYIWNEAEPVRAQGLAHYPSLYAFTALIAFCWALASKKLVLLRSAVVVMSVFLCFLTGTRTAFFAFALVLMAFIILLAKRGELVSWFKINYKTFLIVNALIVVLIGGVGVFVQSNNVVRNIPSSSESIPEESVTSYVEQPKSDYEVQLDQLTSYEKRVFLFVDEFTSGRGDLWFQALERIASEPLGSWQPSGFLLDGNGHAHNEVLNRWITGGPVAVALYLWFLVWLLWKPRSKMAPFFPKLLAIALLSFGLFEVVFDQAVFAPIALFVLGYVTTIPPPTENGREREISAHIREVS
ncbi:MAG: O-antigen ligase family protein [Coriobacteriia bacterium]|nr:O-antigen ligase family protein [Coriobacteriia bacterium]